MEPKDRTSEPKKEEDVPYLRVGTRYYKNVKIPLSSEDFLTKIEFWSKANILDDHGKLYISKIPKYDAFCVRPEHLKYERIISNCYNKYEPFPHTPKEGKFEVSMEFASHIFGDQLQLGLDYLQILLLIPKEKLPILCLISKERETGKSTFLNWLKNIFGANMTINTNEDFRSRFNSDWASKVLVGIEEALLDKVEDSERLKNLSTAKTYKAESKGVDKTEIEFFAKFILCSNNEKEFIKIDPFETRYWVRKISKIERKNTRFLEDLINEIPAFLYFLQHRQLSTKKASRMWFSATQIYTDALQQVIKANRPILEKEMRELIIQTFLEYELEEVCFSQKDFQEKLYHLKPRATRVKEILEEKWGYEVYKNSTYKSYEDSTSMYHETKKGRYYLFKKSDFVKENLKNTISGFSNQILK